MNNHTLTTATDCHVLIAPTSTAVLGLECWVLSFLAMLKMEPRAFCTCCENAFTLGTHPSPGPSLCVHLLSVYTCLSYQNPSRVSALLYLGQELGLDLFLLAV